MGTVYSVTYKTFMLTMVHLRDQQGGRLFQVYADPLDPAEYLSLRKFHTRYFYDPEKALIAARVEVDRLHVVHAIVEKTAHRFG